MRVGLIGAGGIAHHHLPHLLRLGADVTVHSSHGADELVAAYGGTTAASLPELLERVDVVDVVTPTHTHGELIRTALAHGKHVISEKPLTRHHRDSLAVVEAAEAAGRFLLPAHVVRFFPEYAQLKSAVDAGLLGDLAVLRFTRSGAAPTTAAPWFADEELSGGIIVDQLIHDLDIARWVAGPVATVSAATAGKGGVRSAHITLVHHSGAITHVYGEWGAPHLTFSTSFSVTGTDGQLEHSSRSESTVTEDLDRSGAGGTLVPVVDPTASPYFLQLRELTRQLTTGRPSRVDARDGAEAVRLAVSALEAATTGRPVHLAGA
nr:Gfo/Idh/MocA family oxidoreductase [Kineococcus aurantiacus]